MQPLTILKLGGSAITDKGRECTPDIPTIQSLADQLRDYDLPLILIHGGGSYAHPFVAESGLGKGLRNRSQLRFISETEIDCEGPSPRDRKSTRLTPVTIRYRMPSSACKKKKNTR